MEIPSKKVEIIEEYEYALDEYKHLCVYAFDVITTHLNKKDLQLKIPDKFNNKQYPLFVTWSLGKEKTLRGCIGTFMPDDLEKNLTTYSFYAAFKDTRFRPISLKELCHLHCGVSLLDKFEEADDSMDWEVGKHGITIDFFSENGKKHHATFLPEVASGRDWDKKTTLKNLIQKAGYNGKLNDVIDEIRLTRYQSIKVGMFYDEYLNHKNNTK
jgi:AMME syndrome candidate gene 1 protein